VRGGGAGEFGVGGWVRGVGRLVEGGGWLRRWEGRKREEGESALTAHTR